MSNLLKSKFLLGALVVAFMFVAGFAVSANSASAACSITSTLRVGSKGAQVMCLQTAVGVTADGSFGPKTKAAVVAWQASVGLTADGVFGPKSRAAWMGGAVSGNFPAGCTSASGFSPTTGVPCNSGPSMGFPAGCSSSVGFSATTGVPCNGTSGMPQGTGPVTVSLAVDNPASGSLLSGQATADLMHVNFMGNGTVTSLTLQRTGLSTSTALQSVYLYDGATRLTDAASVNTNGVITFSGLNLMVNGTKTISVKADITASASSNAAPAGQTVGVTLTGYTVSGASAMTTANVSGNIMSIGNGYGVLGTVAFVSPIPTSPAVDAGVTNYILWTAPVQISTHAMWLKSAAFHFIGSAPADSLANIGLYVDGTKVASAAGVNSLGYIVFDFMAAPYSLTTGSHTVDVRADIVKGSYRSILVTLQNAGDFMVTDAQLGVNVAAVSPLTNSTSFAPVAGNSISVNQGSLSIQLDPSFTALTSVTGGASNTLIAKYKVTAYGEDEKVQTIILTPAVAGATGGHTNVNNVALYFNGSQVGSSCVSTSNTAAACTFNLGSSMIVPAGTSNTLEVRGDLQDFSGASYVDGSVTVSGATVPIGGAQGMMSLQTNPAAVTIPSTNALSISTGTVAISANPALATTQSVSPNTANTKIGSFVVQNQSSSESIHVTNLQVGLTFGAAVGGGSTNYSNLLVKTADGSMLRSESSSTNPINPSAAAPSTTSTNQFSVDFVLAPGATKTLDIYADTGSVSLSGTTVITKLIVTANGSSSNVAICSPSITTGSVNGCNTATAASGQTTTVTTGTFGNGGVVVSSSTVPQYVAGGTTGVVDATKQTLNFKATSASATITELKFKVTTSTGSSVSSIRVGNVSAPVVGGIAWLTGLNLVVPNGGSGLNVDAFMTYGPVGSNGNFSGAESFVETTYVKYTMGGVTTSTVGGDPIATGTTSATDTLLTTLVSNTSAIAIAGSTATLTTNAGGTAAMQPGMKLVIPRTATTPAIVEVQSITDSTHFVEYTVVEGVGAVATQPVYFYSIPQTPDFASSVENCTVNGTEDCMSIVGSKPSFGIVDASTQLTNGLVKVGSVTVTADAKGDIALNALPLLFTSTGNVSITGGTVVVKNTLDSGTTLNTTNSTLTFAGGASDDTLVTFVGGYTVLAGQTVTLDIYVTAATVTGGAGSNALSMGLYTADTLTWTDIAGNGNSAAETGKLIYGYPTTSSTIND